MHAVIIAVVIVAITGLILGIVLSVASVVMKVPVDETAVEIEENLAGANCGACGYSGCSGYASALSKGDCTDTTLCAPGGADTAKAIASILGVSGGELRPMTAFVACHGGKEECDTTMNYHGDMSCKTAAQLSPAARPAPSDVSALETAKMPARTTPSMSMRTESPRSTQRPAEPAKSALTPARRASSKWFRCTIRKRSSTAATMIRVLLLAKSAKSAALAA